MKTALHQKDVHISDPIYGHPFDEEQFSKLTYKTHTAGLAYDPKESLAIGPFTFTFLKTVHPVDCFAMRVTDGVHSVATE